MLLAGPVGSLPSERQITLYPPSNHSQVSEAVYLPPGPIGPGFSSPSTLHLPTKNPSFLCSGPGAGAPWAAATAAPVVHSTVSTARALKTRVIVSSCDGWTPPEAPLMCVLSGTRQSPRFRQQRPHPVHQELRVERLRE